MTPALDEFFTGYPQARAVYDGMRALLDAAGPYRERVSKSQIAFRRRRGFAYLWIPGRYLRNATAPAVVSIALDHQNPSPRFKQVVHPATRVWMHHLEIHQLSDLDDEVGTWLREAAGQAG